MSKVYEYYASRHEIDEEFNDNYCGIKIIDTKLCDGDCGNVYSLEDLYSTCYTQDFCKDCMCDFLAEQEDGMVSDAITGEE